MAKRKRYYATIERNGSDRQGTEMLVTIYAPDRRAMAVTWFWLIDGKPSSGNTLAKADAKLIVDALNAYTQGGPAHDQ